MEQSETGPIRSDYELFACFGLTLEQASDRIGVSCSSIRERGLLPREIVDLRLSMHRKGVPVTDEPSIIAYVLQQRGQEAADLVREGFDLMSAPPKLDSFTELQVLIPNIDGMKEVGSAECFRDLLLLPGALTFFTIGPSDQRTLKEFLGEEVISERTPPITFRWDTAVTSWPVSILGDPSSESITLYYRATEGWVRVPHEKAASNVRFVLNRSSQA